MYWYQPEMRSFEVGQIMSDTAHKELLNKMRSDGAVMLDITKIPPKTQARLIDKYFNGLGTTNDTEQYAEALKLNGAVEIK